MENQVERCQRCNGIIKTWKDAFLHTRNDYCLAILEGRKLDPNAEQYEGED